MSKLYKFLRDDTNEIVGIWAQEISVGFVAKKTEFNYNSFAEYIIAMKDTAGIIDASPESSWFAGTSKLAQNMKNLGFPNVFDVSTFPPVVRFSSTDNPYYYFTVSKGSNTVEYKFYYNNEARYTETVSSSNINNVPFSLFSCIEGNANNSSGGNPVAYRLTPNVYETYITPGKYWSDRLDFYYWAVDGSITNYFGEWWSKQTEEVPPVEPSDPYAPGGDSGAGGGTGTFDGTGDDINIPALPTLSATETGFITLFNPSLEQLKNLANYMWSNAFDLDTLKKLFANPMDCILGLSIVPVAVPNGETGTVSVGNISTGVSMTKAATQYVEIDCGTLNVEEYWGAYLDYDPHTKAEIYLPYIGTHPVAVDDIMGKPVHVVYHIDILSGACSAFVKCGGSVLYTFIGQCSSSIPVTGNDWTNVINGVLSIAGAVGTMVATGGASAPTAVGTIASTAVNSMKPSVEKSGSLSGTGGMLGVQTPYLILTRPRQAVPSQQNKFMGYPSFITENLGSISGYTEVEFVHLENISATESELSEIENLLKTGVIF